jgi:hypothetical protein
MEGMGAQEKIPAAPSFSLQKVNSKADKKLLRSNSVTTCKQVVRSSSPSKKANFVQINLRMFNNYFHSHLSHGGFQQLSTRPGSMQPILEPSSTKHNSKSLLETPSSSVKKTSVCKTQQSIKQPSHKRSSACANLASNSKSSRPMKPSE